MLYLHNDHFILPRVVFDLEQIKTYNITHLQWLWWLFEDLNLIFSVSLELFLELFFSFLIEQHNKLELKVEVVGGLKGIKRIPTEKNEN